MSDSTTLPATNFYKPSELMGIFKNFFSNKEINASVICLQGVYYKSDKIYGNYAWDQLKDENTPESMTIVVPVSLRDDLKNGNLITVFGTIDRKVQNSGSIQFLLNVSRVEKNKDIAISEDEIKRAEYRRKKEGLGYKNVDSILENKLFVDERPKVALVYADTSITNADFEKGLAAAKSNIDFQENRVSFANAQALCDMLKRLDNNGFDVIAIVRGGGSGIEKLDDLAVVETLTNLNTAWIYGVGHEKENLFIRNIADKVYPIPFALGTYFRDTVERVIEKRNNSRAVLVEEVKKQYIKQIEDSNKKNTELTKQLENLQKQNKEQNEASQKQIAALTKTQEEINKKHSEQVQNAQKQNSQLQEQLKNIQKTHDEQLSKLTEAQKKQQDELIKKHTEQFQNAQKQNEELQKKLTEITKANESVQKQQSEAMLKLQNQVKEQSETHTKQAKEFSDSIKKMQETNTDLNKSITILSDRNAKAIKDLNDAKERQRDLEQRLQKAKDGNTKQILIVIAIALVILVVSHMI